MGTPERATIGTVFGVAEFRALWAAELCSIIGDQLARVALAVIVFDRTESAGWTAATYALTFAPAFLGAMMLGWLGDRYPRRNVMLASDLARALLVGLMAVPGMPLAVLCTLVAGMTFVAGPFKAAQQALLPEVFASNTHHAPRTTRNRAPGNPAGKAAFEVGQSLRAISNQAGQLAGFAAGGVLVALSPPIGLLVDAATFLISAAILWWGVQPHPPPVEPRAERPGPRLAPFLISARLIWRSPLLRSSFALAWLVGVYIAPEALAAPYAAALGAGSVAVGLLMASDPVGSLLGGVVWTRAIPERVRDRLVGLLTVLAGIPLLACWTHPGLVVSMILFALTGLAVTIVVIRVNVVFSLALPDQHRAQGNGLFSAALLTAQGLGALAAGLLADWIGAVAATATAGAVGIVLAVPTVRAWRRAVLTPPPEPA